MAPLVGFVALMWFVVRVLPKPSRAAYPCQRVAAPLASGFVAWVVGVAGSAVLFRRARTLARNSRLIAAAVFLAAASALWWTGSSTVESASGGIRLTSLGVHEHWNNSDDKLYSRNLGSGDGIELISDPPSIRCRGGSGGRVRP